MNKKLSLLVFGLILGIQAKAADFTINFTANSSYKAKGDGVILGPIETTYQTHLVLNNKTYLLNNNPVNVDSNGYGDFLSAQGVCFFQSTDCSGACLVPPESAAAFMLPNYVGWFSSYSKVIEMTSTTMVSDGTMAVGSCMNAYNNICYTAASNNMNGCSGSSQVLTGFNIRNGKTMKIGNMYDASSVPTSVMPSHKFRFRALEYIRQ